MDGGNNMTVTITNTPCCIRCYRHNTCEVFYHVLSDEILKSQPDLLYHSHDPVNNINVIIHK